MFLCIQEKKLIPVYAGKETCSCVSLIFFKLTNLVRINTLSILRGKTCSIDARERKVILLDGKRSVFLCIQEKKLIPVYAGKETCSCVSVSLIFFKLTNLVRINTLSILRGKTCSIDARVHETKFKGRQNKVFHDKL